MNQPTDGNKQGLEALLASAVDLVKADRGCIMFPKQETGELQMQATHNYDMHGETDYFRLLRSAVVRYVIEKGPLVTLSQYVDLGERNFDISLHENSWIQEAFNLRFLIGVPLRIRENIRGVLYVEKRIKNGVWEQEDLRRLEEFVRVNLPESSEN